MSEKSERTEPTPEELEREEGETLPDREVMSLISLPTIAPEPFVPDDPNVVPPHSE